MTSTTRATASTDAILVTSETLRCSRTNDRRSNAGSVTWREYEQKIGNALDEDGKVGVFLALTPPSVQNHCHSNSNILKSNTHVSTMLFDCCRAQADVAASENMPMDLSMLGKGKRAKTTSKAKGGDSKDDKKEEGENGKGKDNAKATEYFVGYCLQMQSW